MDVVFQLTNEQPFRLFLSVFLRVSDSGRSEAFSMLGEMHHAGDLGDLEIETKI